MTENTNDITEIELPEQDTVTITTATAGDVTVTVHRMKVKQAKRFGLIVTKYISEILEALEKGKALDGLGKVLQKLNIQDLDAIEELMKTCSYAQLDTSSAAQPLTNKNVFSVLFEQRANFDEYLEWLGIGCMVNAYFLQAIASRIGKKPEA